MMNMSFSRTYCVLMALFAILMLPMLTSTVIARQDEDVDRVINRLLEEQRVARHHTRSRPDKESIEQQQTGTLNTWEFVAEGIADIAPGQDKSHAKENAIKNALRNAVEQGVGVFIDSSTLVKNYSVEFDTIFSKAAGYVRTYKVLEEWSDKGLYHVRVLAEIGMGNLQHDLVAVETFKKLVQYPRIMVSGKELIDGQPQPESRLVKTAIESILADSGYDLVDPEQLEAVQQRDMVMAKDERERLILGQRFGADIHIKYTAEAVFASRDTLYGTPAYFYKAVVDCRVIKTDTGRIMFSRSVKVRRGAEDTNAAAQGALHFAGKKMAYTLKNDVLKQWIGEVLEGGVWLELKVSNISFQAARDLAETIRGWQHVNSVREPAYIRGTAIFQVRANMAAPALTVRLLRLESPGFKVEEVMQNSIKLRTIEQ